MQKPEEKQKKKILALIGTRVGELVVLKKEDMLDNEVYIHKMEMERAQKILEEVEKLSPDSEYLFTQANGERMTSRSFNY